MVALEIVLAVALMVKFVRLVQKIILYVKKIVNIIILVNRVHSKQQKKHKHIYSQIVVV